MKLCLVHPPGLSNETHVKQLNKIKYPDLVLGPRAGSIQSHSHLLVFFSFSFSFVLSVGWFKLNERKVEQLLLLNGHLVPGLKP